MTSVILSCLLFDVKTVCLYKVLNVYNGYKIWLLPINKFWRFLFYNSNILYTSSYLKHTFMTIVNIVQNKIFLKLYQIDYHIY